MKGLTSAYQVSEKIRISCDKNFYIKHQSFEPLKYNLFDIKIIFSKIFLKNYN